MIATLDITSQSLLQMNIDTSNELSAEFIFIVEMEFFPSEP